MPAKRYPLPKRFNAALSFGNNYLLTIVLENFEQITDSRAVDRVFSEFAREFGAPVAGRMKKST